MSGLYNKHCVLSVLISVLLTVLAAGCSSAISPRLRSNIPSHSPDSTLPAHCQMLAHAIQTTNFGLVARLTNPSILLRFGGETNAAQFLRDFWTMVEQDNAVVDHCSWRSLSPVVQTNGVSATLLLLEQSVRCEESLVVVREPVLACSSDGAQWHFTALGAGTNSLPEGILPFQLGGWDVPAVAFEVRPSQGAAKPDLSFGKPSQAMEYFLRNLHRRQWKRCAEVVDRRSIRAWAQTTLANYTTYADDQPFFPPKRYFWVKTFGDVRELDPTWLFSLVTDSEFVQAPFLGRFLTADACRAQTFFSPEERYEFLGQTSEVGGYVHLLYKRHATFAVRSADSLDLDKDIWKEVLPPESRKSIQRILRASSGSIATNCGLDGLALEMPIVVTLITTEAGWRILSTPRIKNTSFAVALEWGQAPAQIADYVSRKTTSQKRTDVAGPMEVVDSFLANRSIKNWIGCARLIDAEVLHQIGFGTLVDIHSDDPFAVPAPAERSTLFAEDKDGDLQEFRKERAIHAMLPAVGGCMPSDIVSTNDMAFSATIPEGSNTVHIVFRTSRDPGDGMHCVSLTRDTGEWRIMPLLRGRRPVLSGNHVR